MTEQPQTGNTISNGSSTAPNRIDKLAIVVVTFKRQELLAKLFDSFCGLTRAPWRIVIVDNENSEQTRQMVEDLGRRTNELWGVEGDAADTEGGTARVVYAPQSDNLSGAGGFSAGVAKAYELGAAWFWVMDDDVIPAPDALQKLLEAEQALQRRAINAPFVISTAWTPDGLLTNVPPPDCRSRSCMKPGRRRAICSASRAGSPTRSRRGRRSAVNGWTRRAGCIGAGSSIAPTRACRGGYCASRGSIRSAASS